MVLIRREENGFCTILDRCISRLELSGALERISKELLELNYRTFFMDTTKTSLVAYRDGESEIVTFMGYHKPVPAHRNTFYYR